MPTGKAFVITGVSGWDDQADTTGYYPGFVVYSGASCSGSALTGYYNLAPPGQFFPVDLQFGNGIAVPAGSTISVFADNNYGLNWIHGYLVPAATVPATALPGPVAAAVLSPRR